MENSENSMHKQISNTGLNTEDKIFEAAYNVFLLFGYHGATLSIIATNAGVNKAAIHYYFRSKEKLYAKVVRLILDFILSAKFKFPTNPERLGNSIWFIYTELYNNQILFEHTIKELHPDDWESKLKDLTIWLKFSESPFSYTYRSSKANEL